MSDINLLPWRQTLAIKNQRRLKLTLLAVASLLFIGLCALNHLISLPARSQKAINRLLTFEIRRITPYAGHVPTLHKKKEQLIQRLAQLAELQQQRFDTVKLLDILAKNTPPGIYLTRFQRKAQRCLITGDAENNFAISKLIKAVQATSLLSHPQLEEITQEQASEESAYIQFKLQLNINSTPLTLRQSAQTGGHA